MEYVEIRSHMCVYILQDIGLENEGKVRGEKNIVKNLQVTNKDG
jgi:hypothetical protein